MSDINKSIKKFQSCSYANAKVLGIYWPQGLTIKINDNLTSQPIDYQKNNNNLTLIHEYRHFLDDATTFFGMQAFLFYWTTIFSIIKINKGVSKIKLPIIQLGQVGTLESQSWLKWYNGTYGNSDMHYGYNDNIEPSIIDIKFKPDLKIPFTYESKSYDIPIPSCTLIIKQRDHLFNYELGAIAVLESLATLLEDSLVEHSQDIQLEQPPTFPYRAFQYAVAYYLKKGNSKMSIDRKIMAQIADRSLMTIAPGFFAARYMEEQIAHPQQTVDEIVKIVNLNYPFKYDALISSILADLKNLADKFSISPMKKEMFQWFTTNIEKNFEIRKGDPDRFIRPLLSDDPWGECIKLLNDFPIPIIFHNGMEYYTLRHVDVNTKHKEYTGSNATLFFRLLQFVIDLHIKRNQKIKCPIYNGCMQDFKNEDCCDKPWKLADRELSCVTGSAFAFSGVKGKKVKNRHNR